MLNQCGGKGNIRAQEVWPYGSQYDALDVFQGTLHIRHAR